MTRYASDCRVSPTTTRWCRNRAALAKDGPRYRALGNSMAVNVMRWIGTRIAIVEKII